MAEEPPYLKVGTDVSAKYKGAFCEAKITEVKKHVKLRVSFEGSSGTHLIDDTDLKPGSSLDVGTKIEAKHPEMKQQTYVKATITKILDHSRYTVIFDDGDNCVLRRNSICLKSGKHFDESETLDQLPLTNPEHFGNPVKNTTGDTGIKVDLITRGMKLMVKYGEGKMRNVYEAKVNKIETNQTGKTRYFVHYTGWNNRYDEWITKNRILKILTDPDNPSNRDSRTKRQQQQDQQPDETQRQQNHDQVTEPDDDQEHQPEKKPEKKQERVEKPIEKKQERQVEKKQERQVEKKQDKQPEKRQDKLQEKKQEKLIDRRQDKQADRRQDKQLEKKTDNDAQLQIKPQQRSPAQVLDEEGKKVEQEPRQCLENGKSHETKPDSQKRSTAREPQKEKVVAKDDLVPEVRNKQVQPEETKQNQDQKQREAKPQPQTKLPPEPQAETQVQSQSQATSQPQATPPAAQPKQNSRSKPRLQLQTQPHPTPPEEQQPKPQPEDQVKSKQLHQPSEPQRKLQTQSDQEQPQPQTKSVVQPAPKPLEESKSLPKGPQLPHQTNKEEERDVEMQLEEADDDQEEEDRRVDEVRHRRNQQLLLLQQQEQQLPAAGSPTRTMSTSSMDASTTTTTTPTTTAIHLSNGHIYNFCEDINESDCDRKISILQDRIMALRQKYVSLKTELNDLDRRRKRVRTDRFNSDHITQKHTQQF